MVTPLEPHGVATAFAALAAAGERLIRSIPEADAQAVALRERWARNQATFHTVRGAIRAGGA